MESARINTFLMIYESVLNETLGVFAAEEIVSEISSFD